MTRHVILAMRLSADGMVAMSIVQMRPIVTRKVQPVGHSAQPQTANAVQKIANFVQPKLVQAVGQQRATDVLQVQ